jgi:serine/threonine-protein kinase
MAQQKYTILEKIDAGGMAEVWKAKATSLRGFEKLVAIKRVLPNLARNKKFISMFLDEARLSLYLNHANVVQTFDIGVSDSSYFIVMEYVDGSNLKSILDAFHARGFRVPPEQAAFIGIEICKGLSHAHQRRDPNDRPLNIVHRDVSPPNVLISKEGEVKLVDFGLAKAASQLALTDPGVVKGKFSYLSPEAAFGQEVDFRADIFATGILLWETLSGRRLFDGKTDLETVELVRKVEVPPLRDFNPDVPPALEAIIRKALSRDPRHRQESASELAHDLSRFLFENRLMVTSYDIALLVKRVLAEKSRDKDAPRMTSSARAIGEMIQEHINQFTSLEDLEKMAFKPVSEIDPEHTLGGEDPRQWAADMSFDDGDRTTVDLSPYEKSALGFQQGKTLEEMLEGRDGGSSVETLPAPGVGRVAVPVDEAPVRTPAPEVTRSGSTRAVRIEPPGETPVPRNGRTRPPPVPESPVQREQRAAAAAAAALKARNEDATSKKARGVVILFTVGVVVAGAAWFLLHR